jgi:hypothetical protein
VLMLLSSMHEENKTKQNHICGLRAIFGTLLKQNMHDIERVDRHVTKYFNFTEASLHPRFPIN